MISMLQCFSARRHTSSRRSRCLRGNGPPKSGRADSSAISSAVANRMIRIPTRLRQSLLSRKRTASQARATAVERRASAAYATIDTPETRENKKTFRTLDSQLVRNAHAWIRGSCVSPWMSSWQRLRRSWTFFSFLAACSLAAEIRWQLILTRQQEWPQRTRWHIPSTRSE